MRSATRNPANTEIGYATAVRCDGESIWVTLSTGRVVQDAVAKYPFLASAPLAARIKVRIEDFGTALHWSKLDEDLGVNTILGVSEEEVARAAGFTVYASQPSGD